MLNLQDMYVREASLTRTPDYLPKYLAGPMEYLMANSLYVLRSFARSFQSHGFVCKEIGDFQPFVAIRGTCILHLLMSKRFPFSLTSLKKGWVILLNITCLFFCVLFTHSIRFFSLVFFEAHFAFFMV
jgi:hypothetical protein